MTSHSEPQRGGPAPARGRRLERIDCELLNPAGGDPGVVARLRGLRRTLLFDLGEHRLPVATLLQVSDLFLSHLHIDHFAGFDRLLRGLLGAPRTVRVWGPAGVTAAVRSKLRGYLWNLSFDDFVAFEVNELRGRRLRRTVLSLEDRFRSTRRLGERVLRPATRPRGGAAPSLCLLEEPQLKVEVAPVDHGTECLAYALQQAPCLHLDPARLAAAGLQPGPELAALKRRLQAPDADPADALEYGSWNPGQRMAYVTDCGFTPTTVRGAVAVAVDADRLYCEATYPDERAAKAAAVHHLTAGQAGTLARLANARELVVAHFSRRYADEPELLRAEALRCCTGPSRWSHLAQTWIGSGKEAGPVVG